MTLNEYIRNVANLKGTKYMCNEGGCGVCVVSVQAALPPTQENKTFAVNSCLVSILSCHGWEITTIEGIGNKHIGYHEIQKRLTKFSGTQCGYCSPGMVMNMYSIYKDKNGKLTSSEIENSFGGNICRCTGYRSIADAFKSFATDANHELLKQVEDIEDLGAAKCPKNCIHKKCKVIERTNKHEIYDKSGDTKEKEPCKFEEIKTQTDMLVIDCGAYTWYKVFTLNDVFKIMRMVNEYKLIAGNTGQGVFKITDYQSNIIDIFSVSELKDYIIDVNLILGSGITLTKMMEIIHTLSVDNEDFSYLKEFHGHMDLIAHIPVRNIGTIGGNLMLKHYDNSFPSDLFLLFEMVGGMVTIAESKEKKQALSYQEFLTTDMNKKIILNVIVPPLSKWCSVKTFKIMPRAQNAHAIVNAGFLFKSYPNSRLLESATIVYGGISNTFIHAEITEGILAGKDPFTNETLQLALGTLLGEIKPEHNPPDPSVDFRKMLAVSLFYKAILYLCPDDVINPIYRSGGEILKRSISNGTQSFETDRNLWPLNQPVNKIEAIAQCSGEAIYSNDITTESDEIFAAFVTADANVGSIVSGFDVTEAFKLAGVLSIYTAKDIPGDNTFTPSNIPLMNAKEEILCSGKVMFYGQPAAIIVASREKTAIKAANLVKIMYSHVSTQKPLLTTDEVLDSVEVKERTMNNISIAPTDFGNDVKHVLKGEFKLKSQCHFYMEPQTCVVKPVEDSLEVYSSTQWLDLTSTAIAQCLKIPLNKVNVIVRRVGGGYGGKISRSAQIACATALVSFLQGKTCRFVLPLLTNMKSLGKRLPVQNKFEVGVNDDGKIQYLKKEFYHDCGHSFNENISATTVMHITSSYDTRRWQIDANSVITDNASNTYCRSPSSTEAIAMVENIMEFIAYSIAKDPIEVRLQNMLVDKNPLPEMIIQLKSDSEYDSRLNNIKIYNEQNHWRKKSLRIMPMTFEIFYFGNFNSVISIYHADGSVVIHHGGIEMGQGLNTKVAQVCAYVLGAPLAKIEVQPSTSFISPNAMVTGASIGSECVAFATIKACEIILERLAPIKETETLSWEELISTAYAKGIDLQASYMYSGKDDLQPYNVYAVCALEVEIDLLTGNHDVKRVDLLEDTGRSLSPIIDITQIEGAFAMGLGYWTSENLVYDELTGKLLTDTTWTYKPPGFKDIPADLRIYFRRNAGNEFGVLQSKATGEPAFCLATILIHAIREALQSSRHDSGYPDEWLDIGLSHLSK
nr:indole-3-acetaldehyde oxidase-like [Danaus plexippus plexippus]